jgi:hypothetical protein
MQVYADQYINDPTEDTPVWLHAKLDNETGERRALVRNIQVQYGASWYGDEATVNDIPVTITVIREPYWESTTARDMPASAALSGAAVEYDYTAAGASVAAHDIVGDVGARIDHLSILGDTGDDAHENAWIGLRSDAKADTTYFDPIWECEDGTLAGAVATSDAVTEPNTASPGGGSGVYVVGTPTADNTWELYLSHRVSNTGVAVGNVDSLIGTFLWLLRSKVVASNVFEVQVRFGVFGLAYADYIRGPIVEIDHTDWKYTEMGVSSLPIWDIQGYSSWNDNNLLWNHEFQIWARRTSGSDNIHLDCVCPIPVDEGFLHYSNALDAGVTYYVSFFDSPKRILSMLTVDKNNIYSHSIPSFNTQNFVLPPGNGRLYCVYSGSSEISDITNSINFNPADKGKYYERWLSLRGSE